MNTITANLVHPWMIMNGTVRCPVTMIREGVLTGNHGPVFWPAIVLHKNAIKWNNIPVTLNHPKANGKFVGVNHDDTTRSWIIGQIIKPRFDVSDKSIKAFIKIPFNHPQLSRIQNFREVSIGVFSDEVEITGNHNGRNYTKVATTMTPDHLALLTDEKGAYSWEDGCGLRTNEFYEVEPLIQLKRY